MDDFLTYVTKIPLLKYLSRDLWHYITTRIERQLNLSRTQP